MKCSDLKTHVPSKRNETLINFIINVGLTSKSKILSQEQANASSLSQDFIELKNKAPAFCQLAAETEFLDEIPELML